MELPLESVDKLIQKSSIHRFSAGAARESVAHSEETAIEIAREAGTTANFTGKKLVEVGYIEFARKGKSRLTELMGDI